MAAKRKVLSVEQLFDLAKGTMNVAEIEQLVELLTEKLIGAKPSRRASVTNNEGKTRVFQCTDFELVDGRLILRQHGQLVAIFNDGVWSYLGLEQL